MNAFFQQQWYNAIHLRPYTSSAINWLYKTIFISSPINSFLAVLVVVPSIIEFDYVMDRSTKSKIIVTCCAYLRLLNSFNMVALFLYRQQDFRRNARQHFNYGRKQRVHAVVGFGRWTNSLKSNCHFVFDVVQLVFTDNSFNEFNVKGLKKRLRNCKWRCVTAI